MQVTSYFDFSYSLPVSRLNPLEDKLLVIRRYIDLLTGCSRFANTGKITLKLS